MEFTDDQINRYSRHLILGQVGVEGQEKISKAKILVIGAGGLGSPALLYLAAAGVGTLGIADADVVDLSNLQRQVVHFTQDVNKPKVDSAREKINQMNPDVNVNTIQGFVDKDNIFDIIQDYDFVIDGTDNHAAKFLINDACWIAKKPLSHGGILQFDGQTMTILPGQSASYRCLFPEVPPPNSVPSCSQAGILGAIAGVLGTIQATEALKYVLGLGHLLTDRLLIFNALRLKFREVKVKRRIGVTAPDITELGEYEAAVCAI